ncbi:MAG: hypothetical protein IPN29_09135 [Saprospiraceae bacterium]|nr:hypothetical protein [Saprospiraceae bacterium]
MSVINRSSLLNQADAVTYVSVFMGIFFFGLVYLSSSHIFFWDTVQLAAKHATFFYDQGFGTIILPAEFDSGHLPGFGLYLALVWKIFGKTLGVSHFAMLPILWWLVWQVKKTVVIFIPKSWRALALLLILSDPTLMAQSSLVSPDLVLMAAFFTAIVSFKEKTVFSFVVAIIVLVITSNRGFMITLAIFMANALASWLEADRGDKMKAIWEMAKPFIPGFFIFMAYQFYHFQASGWVGYHDQSPWAASFQSVDLVGFLRNLILLIWRMLDFGRIAIWVVIFALAILQFRLWKSDEKVKLLVILWLFLLAMLAPSFLGYVGLSGHRYLLPLYLLAAILCARLTAVSDNTNRVKAIIFILMMCSLWTGHLWRYPEGVAQGWDASLAHWPYYRLRLEMNTFMHEKEISITEVGSAFPNLAEWRYLDLSDSKIKHAARNLPHTKYFLYSNMYNEITPTDANILNSQYRDIKSIKNAGIRMVLYQRK